MTINEMKFVYANEHSDKYGVVLCSFDGNNIETNDESSNIILSTTPFKDTWDFHGVEKSEPLKFSLTIAKKNETYFDAYETRLIKKWLCKKRYHWLQIDQDDISSAYYYCIINNPKPINVGKYSGGLEFSVTCNAPYAWTDIKSRTFSSTSSKNLLINLETDFDEYKTYPILTITANSSGNISIKNTITDNLIEFKNCANKETITLDCRNYKIKSSTGRTMLDYWNKNVLDLDEGRNTITMTGNFTMKLEYRLPIRIGG